MGNAAICLVGKRTVRVVRPDGMVEELDYKMEVSELMKQYPGFMVVHCSTSGNSLGQRSKISIMNTDQKLAPGQAYVLYPIPAQYKASFVENPTSPSELNQRKAEDGNGTKRTRRRRKSPIQAVVECLIRLLKTNSTSSDRHLNDGSSPLLDSNLATGDESSGIYPPNTEKHQSLNVDPYAWRPALEAIPESPFGYHDMPQSPFSFDMGEKTSLSAPQSPRPQVPLGLGLEHYAHPFSTHS